mmetsp:Transcript_8014/g.28161  ORF Transcript_8014/g.28161 Transcript_8014/m.28161 type:complete len:88 (-) Transcript_8014:1856-2119(-)
MRVLQYPVSNRAYRFWGSTLTKRCIITLHMCFEIACTIVDNLHSVYVTKEGSASFSLFYQGHKAVHIIVIQPHGRYLNVYARTLLLL